MPPNLAYLAYRSASALARCIPGPAVDVTARLSGRAAARLLPARRTMVERHQRRVRPDLTPGELDQTVKAVFGSYALYWIESFRLPGTSASDLDGGFDHDGFQHLEDALDAGKGVILAMPHLGGWEWAAFWLTACHAMPVTAVVEPVQPPELAEWFIGLRQELGMEVVPLSSTAGADVLGALKRNRVVALLCDRDIAGGGVEVDFFGERTTLPAGPATLALRSGAPILPAAVYFDGTRHRGIAKPPMDTTRQGRLRADVDRITQDLAAELEGLIRVAPEQWHLLQPNWPSDHSHRGSSTCA